MKIIIDIRERSRYICAMPTLTLEQIVKKIQSRVNRNGLRPTAKELDMKPNTLHNYLKGNREPTGENLLKLINRLG